VGAIVGLLTLGATDGETVGLHEGRVVVGSCEGSEVVGTVVGDETVGFKVGAEKEGAKEGSFVGIVSFRTVIP